MGTNNQTRCLKVFLRGPRTSLRFLLTSMLLLQNPLIAAPQGNAGEPKPKVIETTVCAIAKNPSEFDNKIVKVRGYLFVNFELSVLESEGCDDGIWFEYAGGRAPSGLVATVKGKGRPGGKNAKGRPTPPTLVTLVRDSNLEKFERYMTIKAAEKSCDENILAPTPPDCDVDRVTATFIGRVDSASEELHQTHLKRIAGSRPDWKGFGLMGEFEAQIVMQSVENVVAVDSFGRTKP